MFNLFLQTLEVHNYFHFTEEETRALDRLSELCKATQTVANLGFESKLPDSRVHDFKYYVNI